MTYDTSEVLIRIKYTTACFDVHDLYDPPFVPNHLPPLCLWKLEAILKGELPFL